MRLCAPAQFFLHVLINALANAIKHSHPKGSVEVSLSMAEPHVLKLEVLDRGSGMDSDVIEKIGAIWNHKTAIRPNRFGWGVGMLVLRHRIWQL